ncbi:MAG: phosphoribosylglycinamide formyltransferase, formyltetrahydrofolate-dependent [Acidimicrobiales bacterium]|nr:phosphoribosylglycinamide formyltransferase, formyltetrahydrofolate-dependent [Acidimicrobiales bacterium]
MRRIGVLASGSGSILDAILAADLPVVAVVVDRDCRAVEIAGASGVPVELVERKAVKDRVEFTHQVVDALQRHDVELVAMAGFMTILEKPIFDAFPDRVLNTHPSLLPSFRGAHAVEDALAAGVKVTGCTIHLAVPDVDAGPILAQEAVTIRAGDTADELHERIKDVERRLYPDTIKGLIDADA